MFNFDKILAVGVDFLFCSDSFCVQLNSVLVLFYETTGGGIPLPIGIMPLGQLFG